MKFLTPVLLALALTAYSVAEQFSFDGYKLIRVKAKTLQQNQFIQNLGNYNNDFDIWTVNREEGTQYVSTSDVSLSPIAFAKYSSVLKTHQVDFEIVNYNIQQKISEQARSMEKSNNSQSIIYRYARYNEIQNFIVDTVADNPDIASSYLAGRSYEKRELNVVVLKTQTSSRLIWIDCGLHAREWVTPTTCIYTIDTLIRQYRANDPTAVALLNKYEFHILPLSNPDGYEYSHTTFRLWRKNRNPNSGSSCVGTDLNRNFPYAWLTGGSSTSPCSNVYAGTGPGSELETKALMKAIQDRSGEWDAFLNLHSYGNWWLCPFGTGPASESRPDDYDDLARASQFAIDAIKAYDNQTYIFGTSAESLYVNTGSAKDWTRGSENIKHSYVLELRPGPGTSDYSYGFTLPEDRMTKVAPETYAGIIAFLKNL